MCKRSEVWIKLKENIPVALLLIEIFMTTAHDPNNKSVNGPEPITQSLCSSQIVTFDMFLYTAWQVLPCERVVIGCVLPLQLPSSDLLRLSYFIGFLRYIMCPSYVNGYLEGFALG